MKINGTSEVSMQAGQVGMNQASDSYSRNIQKQIASAKEQLQQLSANKDMTMEEKMKKRQEIQQQINELNSQLRQHQNELRKEKQQAKGSPMDGLLGGSRKEEAGRQNTGLSQASMQAVISADVSMKQAEVQGSVAKKMEGRAGVLKAEIRQDTSFGIDTRAKEEELAETEQLAASATASQVGILQKANEEMKDAAKADKTSKTSEAKEDKEKKISGKGEDGQETKPEQGNVSAKETGSRAQEKPANYTPIDICL